MAEPIPETASTRRLYAKLPLGIVLAYTYKLLTHLASLFELSTFYKPLYSFRVIREVAVGHEALLSLARTL